MRKAIIQYFLDRMSARIRKAIARAEANLYTFGGPISADCDTIREWLESTFAYYNPTEADFDDGYPLYRRYAKGRERIDAIDFKCDLLDSELAGYI